MVDINEFKQRRKSLIQSMGEGVAIIPTAPEMVRNRDSHYPYRFDSYFFYLSGFKEPESVLVLIAGSEPKNILFCRKQKNWDLLIFKIPFLANLANRGQ